MKTLILAMLLCFSIPATTGCRTNTAAATVKADKSVVATANTLLDAWSDHYVKERKRLTAAGDTQGLAQLAQNRVAVTDAWQKYQNAATAIVLAQRANYANPTNVTAQVSGAINAAALPVMQLINDFLHK